jgi:hypothetical protein
MSQRDINRAQQACTTRVSRDIHRLESNNANATTKVAKFNRAWLHAMGSKVIPNVMYTTNARNNGNDTMNTPRASTDKDVNA